MRILMILAVLITAACTGPNAGLNIPAEAIRADLAAPQREGR
jgi:hypothetical protein